MTKRAALERLKQQRQSKTSALAHACADSDDDDGVFRQVEEREYEQLQRQRLHDDFVVDDDGLGYVDYGQEQWDEPSHTTTTTTTITGTTGKARKKASRGTANGKKMVDQRIADLLRNTAKRGAVIGPSTTTSTTTTTAAIQNNDEQDDLEAMMREIDEAANATTHLKRRPPKKPVSSFDHPSPPIKKQRIFAPIDPIDPIAIESAPLIDHVDIPDHHHSPSPPSPPPPSSLVEKSPEKSTPTIKHPENEQQPPFEVKLKLIEKKDQSTRKEVLKPTSRIVKTDAPLIPHGGSASFSQLHAIAPLSQPPLVPTQPSETSSTTPPSTATGQDFKALFCEPDGRLLMYWLDAHEVHGTIYVFGKIWNRHIHAFASCCIAVHGMERSLMILPRPYVLDASGAETDQQVDMQILYEELDHLMERKYIKNWGLREAHKKYAFEVPNVPTEADWVEVNYPFSAPVLPAETQGRTFSHVFGTNTGALELFLLQTHLMGPCWVEVKDVMDQSPKLSWCKTEARTTIRTMDTARIEAGDGLNIRPLSHKDFDSGSYPEYCQTAPPLSVMSVSMKTVMNYKKNVNEIAMISLMIHHSVSADGATSEEDQNKVSRYTTVRPLADTGFPIHFTETLKSKGLTIEMVPNEFGLLNRTLAVIHRMDPDVIVGHNFIGFDLDVLLHRMRDLRSEHWSRLGRLRRHQFPKLQGGSGGMGESTYGERQVMSGRLVCDSYLMARDLVKSKSYSLATLSQNVLSVERPAVDHERIPQYYGQAQDLIWLTQHCENDALLSVKLVFQLMAIPLTKQLTNLAGNLWSRTLTGGRSERNEYLLLHEFTKAGYVVPDKPVLNSQDSLASTAASKTKKLKGKKMSHVENLPAEDQDEEENEVVAKAAGTTSGRRKPAYSGGLVLEPKKGLYDKYVLMLDFNSLYPSIIQEYNICFTTVERHLVSAGEEEEVPNIPDPALPQGILPRLLATLVQRRRQVKGLMKGLDPKSAEYAQLNIRQQALKLTANSMYGCLGFTKSRFFAKPLAMLITSKGREILQDTVHLAEETLSLEVIYGDTDSIMIYTASDNLAEVKQHGQRLKQAVNRKYRLLEIEMDGFFKRMLLLMKKKYAAITVTEGQGGTLVMNRETKGLDLVRRDWCELSHDVSNYVLDQILSDGDREVVLENIHSFLQNVGEEIKAGKVLVDKYVINKSLTKNPEEYNDAKVQPHVQVALRLKQKGLSVRVGDTVPYVICQDEDMTKSYALRAYHPDDVKKAESGLKIDIDYYLNNQIYPPVARLCRPIDGTDDARIANCLGLDPSKFRSVLSRKDDDEGLATMESQISDSERFKDADRLQILCDHCGERSVISSMIISKGTDTFCCLNCPACQKSFTLNSVRAQLNCAIRRAIRRYGEGWMLCDEPSCQLRTRRIGVYSRCPQRGCLGVLHPEYTDGMLYNQLLFFSSLFNADRYLKRINNQNEKEIAEVHLASFRSDLDVLKLYVDQYLAINGRGFVDMKKLFSFHDKMVGQMMRLGLGR